MFVPPPYPSDKITQTRISREIMGTQSLYVKIPKF